jgi:hypothetical protein
MLKKNGSIIFVCVPQTMEQKFALIIGAFIFGTSYKLTLFDMLACACRTTNIFEFYKFKYQKSKLLYLKTLQMFFYLARSRASISKAVLV